MTKAVFYGFEGHLRVAWPGVIVCATLAPADIHDRWVAESDLLPGTGQGALVVGDTNYWSPVLTEDLARYGVAMVWTFSRPRDRIKSANAIPGLHGLRRSGAG